MGVDRQQDKDRQMQMKDKINRNVNIDRLLRQTDKDSKINGRKMETDRQYDNVECDVSSCHGETWRDTGLA